MHVGSGSAELTRYYFNPLSRSCFQFVYHGTKGNQNNFRTVDECQTVCPGKWLDAISDKRLQEEHVFLVTPNPCRQGTPLQDPSGRWQKCNSAATPEACGPGYWCHIGADAETTVCCPGSEWLVNNIVCKWLATNFYSAVNPNDICPLAVAAGSGNATLSRWAYNPASRQCSPFNYQGLLGNQNNFQSKVLCEKTCPGTTNIMYQLKY